MSRVLKLKAVNKRIIWGGKKLAEDYGKGVPGESIAEAWELTVHPEGVNTVEGGINAGKPLSDFCGDGTFPIMIKLIDAADRLSVQVHPAKTEMWYVLDAEEGAQLVYGLKEKFDRDVFAKAITDGKVETLLNYVDVKKGDVFFIPQGLVHAIGKGITIAEIQQNSNVTYRIYDYNRLQNGKPRQLHVTESLETIKDFTEDEISAIRYENGKTGADSIANCRYFSVDTVCLDGEMKLSSEDSFVSVICLGGNAKISGRDMKKGDSFFLPSHSSATVKGKAELLITKP